jgi:ribose transport system permease protein
MNKEKFSTLLSDYGMILVLILLVFVFSLSTFKEVAAEGAGAGFNLADKVSAQNPKDAVLIVMNTENDLKLKEAFLKGIKGKGINVKIISVENPQEAKRGLKSLITEVAADCLIVCSKQTGNWTFFNTLGHFKNSQKLIPQTETRSSFLSSGNLYSLPRKTAKTAIIAIGMTMVIITAGIDLSVGSLVALASVISAMLLSSFGKDASGVQIAFAFTAGIGACGVFGFLSGALSTAFKIPAFIVTLAVMLIARGGAQELSGNNAISTSLPDWLGQGAVSVTLMVILYIIAYIVMHKTVFGRQIYAIGGNEEAARLSGVPVNKVLIIVYTVTGLLAGISGVIMTAELNAGIGTFGDTWELNVIAAVVVGGTSLMGGQGKVIGTLIGCAIIEVINNGMNLMGIGSNTQKIVLGLVILLAIIIDKLKKGEVVWISNITRKFKKSKERNPTHV